MNSKLLKNNLLKLLLCNVVVSLVMYLLYWFAKDFVYPTTYVPAPMIVWSEVFSLGIVELIVICITGILFRFKNNKETWIICNALAIFIGIVCSILYGLDNPLLYLFLPFNGVHTICQFTVLDWEMPFWLSILLSAIIFCILQNLFMLPAAINTFIHKKCNKKETE